VKPLRRSFYNRPPEVVAPELIGKLLLRQTTLGLCGGRIVETEAYLPSGDPACHGARGPTPRALALFGPPGHAYVYSIHAKWCFNAVTLEQGIGCAVLIRAIEPLIGVEWMKSRRPVSTERDLARGPARLCAALEITREQNNVDLTRPGQVWIAPDASVVGKDLDIGISTRIGVTSAHELPMRFYLRGSPYVSGPKKLNA
jgi:DNA-3-methyladenine glycosylase